MYDVAEIMSTDLRTLTPGASLADARALMTEHHIRHIPIVDGTTLVGLVTQRDALAAMESTLHKLDEEQRESREKMIRVGDFMTTDVMTVDEKTDIRSAAMHLERHKLGCLPVVTDGKLVGIVTDTDFVGVAINLLEQMEQIEPEED